MRTLTIFYILICTTLSCNKDEVIPETYVNFQIQASEIGGVGQAIYTDLIYGVRGVIIYHSDINQYDAYDRACSYKPSDECEVIQLNDDTVIEISPDKVWFMPAGDTREALQISYPKMFDWVRDNGYRLTWRPHIIAFQDKREV